MLRGMDSILRKSYPWKLCTFALLQGLTKKNEMVKKEIATFKNHMSKFVKKKHSILETTGIEICVGRTRRVSSIENVFKIQQKKGLAEEELIFKYCTNKQMQHHKNNLYTLTGQIFYVLIGVVLFSFCWITSFSIFFNKFV